MQPVFSCARQRTSSFGAVGAAAAMLASIRASLTSVAKLVGRRLSCSQRAHHSKRGGEQRCMPPNFRIKTHSFVPARRDGSYSMTHSPRGAILPESHLDRFPLAIERRL